jgi:hypothetical protein
MKREPEYFATLIARIIIRHNPESDPYTSHTRSINIHPPSLYLSDTLPNVTFQLFSHYTTWILLNKSPFPEIVYDFLLLHTIQFPTYTSIMSSGFIILTIYITYMNR